jgi:hypothetical protein
MYLQQYSSKLANILSDAKSRASQSPDQLMAMAGIDTANVASLLPQNKGIVSKMEKLKRKEAKQGKVSKPNEWEQLRNWLSPEAS